MIRFDVRRLAVRALAFLVAAALCGSAAAQDRARAEANQLHAAIANGDVDAVKYWLDTRHTDVTAAADQEPGVTPLGRCLSLAGRVLDGTPASSTGTTPGVGLRVLQEMVAVLAAHGAKLSDTERARFSTPVIRWYDDAIEHSAPSATIPRSDSAAAQSPPPVIDIARRDTLVVVRPDPKRACNGSGHVVFLVSHALMPITARVETHTGRPGSVKPEARTDTLALEPGASWQLGCDTAPGGAAVRYELKDWKY